MVIPTPTVERLHLFGRQRLGKSATAHRARRPRYGLRPTKSRSSSRTRRRPQRVGRVVDLLDTLIAGILQARRAPIATRNTRHFEGLDVAVVDPWHS